MVLAQLVLKVRSRLNEQETPLLGFSDHSQTPTISRFPGQSWYLGAVCSRKGVLGGWVLSEARWWLSHSPRHSVLLLLVVLCS